MIQIRQPQNDLAARRFPVPLAHMCGLLTAGVHKLKQCSTLLVGRQKHIGRFAEAGAGIN